MVHEKNHAAECQGFVEYKYLVFPLGSVSVICRLDGMKDIHVFVRCFVLVLMVAVIMMILMIMMILIIIVITRNTRRISRSFVLLKIISFICLHAFVVAPMHICVVCWFINLCSFPVADRKMVSFVKLSELTKLFLLSPGTTHLIM